VNIADVIVYLIFTYIRIATLYTYIITHFHVQIPDMILQAVAAPISLVTLRAGEWPLICATICEACIVLPDPY